NEAAAGRPTASYERFKASVDDGSRRGGGRVGRSQALHFVLQAKLFLFECGETGAVGERSLQFGFDLPFELGMTFGEGKRPARHLHGHLRIDRLTRLSVADFVGRTVGTHDQDDGPTTPGRLHSDLSPACPGRTLS